MAYQVREFLAGQVIAVSEWRGPALAIAIIDALGYALIVGLQGRRDGSNSRFRAQAHGQAIHFLGKKPFVNPSF